MLWNIFVHWLDLIHQSITASMENVVVFFQFEYAEFSGYVYFYRFRPQIPFLDKFGPENQNCQFILKFSTWTKLNMQNSMAMFNFSAFYWKYPFWANLVQKIKIVSLGSNFVFRLILICIIQWGCYFFQALILNTFFGHIWSKNSNLFVRGKI